MATTYNVQVEDSEGNKYCPKPDLLTTEEQLKANTKGGKSVDALVVKALNNKLGNCKLVQEGSDFYIVGADSVRKKLGSSERTQVFSGNSKTGHTVNVTKYSGYQNFTLANFCINNATIVYEYGPTPDNTGNVLGSYNKSTGILTLNECTESFPGGTMYIQYTVDLIH